MLPNKSVAELMAAADHDPEAQYQIGMHYSKGTGGVERDWNKALEYLLKAADQGHIEAQICLGGYYFSGLDVTQDYAEASKWFRKAAEQGHARAQSQLATHYFEGLGVTKDYAEAMKWCRRAADQGDAYAQRLAPLYSSVNDIYREVLKVSGLLEIIVNQDRQNILEKLYKLECPEGENG